MDTTRIERDLRILKAYAGAMTLVVGVLSLAAFTRHGPTQVGEIQGTRAKFDVIDVERINVLEPDGKYRLILSNRPRSIGPIYKMKPFGYEGGVGPDDLVQRRRDRRRRLHVYRKHLHRHDLDYDRRRCTKGTFSSSTHMSFDQFNQDQVLNLDYADNNGRRNIGVSVYDRSDVDIHDMVEERNTIMKIADTVARNAALQKWAAPRTGVPLAAQRLFVGRDPSKSAVLNLSDRDGKPRLCPSSTHWAARIELRRGGRSRTVLARPSKQDVILMRA
jgi:hypothetical protein